MAWLGDVEAEDNEATSNLSLGQLLSLCDTVGISVFEALYGPEFDPPQKCTSPNELAELLRQRAGAYDSVESFSEELGWDIAPILKDPRAIETYTLDGLQDICDPLGVYWGLVLQSIVLNRC